MSDLAMGCSLMLSHLTSKAITSSYYILAHIGVCLNFLQTSIKSLIISFPSVRVPVLSNTTVVIWLTFSNMSARLMIMPKEAAIPVPTITAVGVARPSAHGHAITSVDMPKLRAKTNLFWEPSYRLRCKKSK